MTVRELISKLVDLPQGAPVVLNMTRNEMANGKEAKKVEAIQAAIWTEDEVNPKYTPAEYYDENDSDYAFMFVVSIES